MVILYLWLGERIKGEMEMEREFIFREGKCFEVKEKEEIDKMDMEEILEEMEWISEMFEKGAESFDKIVDKMVKEKGNGKRDGGQGNGKEK